MMKHFSVKHGAGDQKCVGHRGQIDQKWTSWDQTRKINPQTQDYNWVQFSAPSSQNYFPIAEAEHPQ